MATQESIQQSAKESLSRIQNLDLTSLVQEARLGELNFKNIVDPSTKLIDLFKLIPESTIDLFPDAEANIIKQQADQIFSIFEQISDFDTNAGNNTERQKGLIGQIENQYQSVFTALFPFIAYSAARTVDFNNLEQRGRAAVQSIRDETNSIISDLEAKQSEAQKVLKDVRKVAEEQGVTQQAIYFKDEADRHATEAGEWKNRTQWMAVIVGITGVTSLFLHKWNWLAPKDTFETAQFIASKLLIFAVLLYLLILCAKNFMSNRHNEVVNRHRQNALLTYKSLADAGQNTGTRDTVLNHAAAAIYNPQDTGFSKQTDAGGLSSSTVVEMLRPDEAVS